MRGWRLTRSSAKEAAKDVVIPGTVALALIALVAKSYGFAGGNSDDMIRARITAIEARQVEQDRVYREDRNEMMRTLNDLSGAVRRIEGKLEK